MPDVEIRPFSDEHLDAAARLLAARHERHLAAEPLLARDVDYHAQIEGELSRGAGAVALVGAEVRAYLVGRVTDEDAVVGLAGCAAAEPELVRDLYASLAARWHREPADLDDVVALEQAFTEHLRAAPSFSSREPRSDAELRAEWAGTWEDERFTHFVALRTGHVVGHALLYGRDADDLRIPANSIDLALVVTAPAARGRGVGSALTAHALGWAHEAGYTAVTIDWRVVNLLASRFFTARGFRPTFYRLYRHVP